MDESKISEIASVQNALTVAIDSQHEPLAHINEMQFELITLNDNSDCRGVNATTQDSNEHSGLAYNKLYSFDILKADYVKAEGASDTTKSYQCQFCYELYTDFDKYLSHEATHLIEDPVPDQQYEKSLYNKNHAAQNNKKNIKNQYNQDNCNSKTSHEFQFLCLFCGQKFSSRKKCKMHEKSHTGGMAYCNCDCQTCESIIRQTDKNQVQNGRPDRPNKEQHPKSHEKQFEEIRAQNKISFFQCEVCSAHFSRWIDFKRHERTHGRTVRQFRCNLCDKTFASSHVFKIHKRSHASTKPFKCRLCSKSFLSSNTWKVHERACKNMDRYMEEELMGDEFSGHRSDNHDQTDPDCATVNRNEAVFTEPSPRSAKTKSLTNKEKSHPCQSCGKIFNRATLCRIHEKSHLNEHNRGRKEFQGKVEMKTVITNAPHSGEHYKGIESETKPENKTDKYKCEYCHMGFDVKSALRKHDLCHSTEKHPYQCQHCSKAFSNISSRKKHESISHKNGVKREYICKFCADVFYLQKDCKMHERSCTNRHRCQYCEQSFATAATLKKHEKSHTGDQQFECQFCSKEFKNANQCRVHERVHTGEKPFECPICAKSFSRSDVCKNHIRTHSTDKPFPCPVCGKRFMFKMACKLHEKIHTNERPHKCEVCGKGFVKKHDCTIHERTHTGEKPYVCKYCNRGFRRLDHKRSHERTHTGEKPFQCQYCVKAFITMQACKMHEMSHTGDKRYMCRHCDHRFSTSQQRQFHERTHTGEKPFQCMYCGKSFAQTSTCKKHELTHTGEKAFQCEYCDKKFISKHDRRIHERTHTGYKPYKCPYCDKAFSRVDTCKHHERTHTGETPYACKFCPKKFSRSDHCKKHEKSHHSDKALSHMANSVAINVSSQPSQVVKPEQLQQQHIDVVSSFANLNPASLTNSVANLTHSSITNGMTNVVTNMTQTVANINTNELLSNDMSQLLYSLALPTGMPPHGVTHNIQIEVSPGTQALIAQGMQPGVQ